MPGRAPGAAGLCAHAWAAVAAARVGPGIWRHRGTRRRPRPLLLVRIVVSPPVHREQEDSHDQHDNRDEGGEELEQEHGTIVAFGPWAAVRYPAIAAADALSSMCRMDEYGITRTSSSMLVTPSTSNRAAHWAIE